MNTYRLSFGLCALIACFSTYAGAQERFEINFQTTCRTTNDSGRLTVRSLGERDLLRACALANNLATTNLKALKLVYTVGADFNGDAIQIVNATNGTVVCTPFRLLFGHSVPSGDGSRVEKLVFVFGPTETEAIGSATVSESTRQVRGAGAVLVRSGKIQFFNDGYYSDRAGICSGVYTTSRAWTPPNP